MKIIMIYDNKDKQFIYKLKLKKGSKVKDAILVSKIEIYHPEINWKYYKIGIFYEIVNLDVLLQTGDRIEIYRPLTIDPKEARKLRAQSYKLKNNNKL